MLLSGCAAPTAAPGTALPSPVVVGAATSAPAEQGGAVLRIPFPPDVPPDAEIDTASIREGLDESGILSAYPGLELVDVATAPGYFVLTFNQPVPTGACQEIFAMFQAAPACGEAPAATGPGGAGAAPPVVGTGAPSPAETPGPIVFPTPDTAAALAAAQRALPSVVVVQTLVGFVASQSPDGGVIKVEATDLPAVEIGDASALQAGEALLVKGKRFQNNRARRKRLRSSGRGTSSGIWQNAVRPVWGSATRWRRPIRSSPGRGICRNLTFHRLSGRIRALSRWGRVQCKLRTAPFVLYWSLATRQMWDADEC